MSIKYIAVGLLIILIIGRLISKSTKAGFGNLGLVTGLALGLSASPILAATITAVFTLAGVLVPIYTRPSQSELSSENSTPSAQQWLGPLAGWLAVGLILGIFLRVNDTLNFSENFRTRYRAQGFSEGQIDSIMAGQTMTLLKQAPETRTAQNRTNLQSDERDAEWTNLLSDLVRPNDTPEVNLQRVRKAVTKEDRERIEWLESKGLPPAAVLEAMKTWHSKEKPAATP